MERTSCWWKVTVKEVGGVKAVFAAWAAAEAYFERGGLVVIPEWSLSTTLAQDAMSMADMFILAAGVSSGGWRSFMSPPRATISAPAPPPKPTTFHSVAFSSSDKGWKGFNSSLRSCRISR